MEDSHLECTRGPHPSRLSTALAWASALRGASSGAGFSEAFPSPFDTEAPFRVFFFFFGFLEAAPPSPTTGCALEAASLHVGCPEQRRTGRDLRVEGLGAPEGGREARGLLGARAVPGPGAAAVSQAGCPRAWREGGNKRVTGYSPGPEAQPPAPPLCSAHRHAPRPHRNSCRSQA